MIHRKTLPGIYCPIFTNNTIFGPIDYTYGPPATGHHVGLHGPMRVEGKERKGKERKGKERKGKGRAESSRDTECTARTVVGRREKKEPITSL